MPLYTNTTKGTVSYQPGTLNASLILPNDTANNDSTTLVEIPELKVAVAANERIVLKYTLFTTTNASGDLKVKIVSPASVALYKAGLVTGGDEGVTTITNQDHTLDLTTDTADDVVEVKALVHNGTTAGNLTFWFAERNASGAGVVVHGGSYLEYMKF